MQGLYEIAIELEYRKACNLTFAQVHDLMGLRKSIDAMVEDKFWNYVELPL